MEVISDSSTPGVMGILHRLEAVRKVQSDGLEPEFNHFDKDDNSDLEDVDSPSTDTKKQSTVFDYLYNQMRRDIKGIDINMFMITRDCAVDILFCNRKYLISC